MEKATPEAKRIGALPNTRKRVSPARSSMLTPLLAVLMLTIPNGSARTQQGDALLGTWSGMGTITLQQGQSERIKCNAYNSASGSDLRLVIRCASTSYKVEVRSSLTRKGGTLSGHWEERTYNATGSASGTIGSGNLALSITGGGFSGRMQMSFTPSHQNVTVTTKGIDMTSLSMSLNKSGN